MNEVRKIAIGLYTPPFRFESGYIFDSKGQMFSDQGGAEACCQRVRGWGRIGYMDNAEAIQDDVGTLIAEILTKHWPVTDADEPTMAFSQDERLSVQIKRATCDADEESIEDAAMRLGNANKENNKDQL